MPMLHMGTGSLRGRYNYDDDGLVLFVSCQSIFLDQVCHLGPVLGTLFHGNAKHQDMTLEFETVHPRLIMHIYVFISTVCKLVSGLLG